MKTQTVEIGFTQESDGKKSRVFDTFSCLAAESFADMEKLAGSEASACELFNAQFRVKLANGSGRDGYLAYKQGKLDMDELKSWVQKYTLASAPIVGRSNKTAAVIAENQALKSDLAEMRKIIAALEAKVATVTAG